MKGFSINTPSIWIMIISIKIQVITIIIGEGITTIRDMWFSNLSCQCLCQCFLTHKWCICSLWAWEPCKWCKWIWTITICSKWGWISHSTKIPGRWTKTTICKFMEIMTILGNKCSLMIMILIKAKTISLANSKVVKRGRNIPKRRKMLRKSFDCIDLLQGKSSSE